MIKFVSQWLGYAIPVTIINGAELHVPGNNNYVIVSKSCYDQVIMTTLQLCFLFQEIVEDNLLWLNPSFCNSTYLSAKFCIWKLPTPEL